MLSHNTIDEIKALLNNKEQYGYEDKEYERTGNTSSGSDTITGISITDLSIDDFVNGDGIPDDSQILQVSGTSIKIDQLCTDTSTAVIDITINHYADDAFEDAIEAVEDEMKIRDFYPVISEGTYSYLNTKPNAELTIYDKMVIQAEQYLIAYRFLKRESLREVSNRSAMREFKTQGGIGTVMSGPTGKQHLAEQYYTEARTLLRMAGYDTSYSIDCLGIGDDSDRIETV